MKSDFLILFKLKPKFCNFLPDQNFFSTKCPKTHELTPKPRQEIITFKKEGYTSRDILNQWTTADYTVWRHQETRHNETKSRAGRPKASTGAEVDFIKVTSLHDRKSDYHEKKCISIHYKRKTLWSWPIWQNCCQETTVEKTKQCQKAPVDQGAQRLDNSACGIRSFDWRIKIRNLWVKYEGNRAIGLMSWVFANGPGDRGSIPGRIIPKTQKWYWIPPCLTLSIIR